MGYISQLYASSFMIPQIKVSFQKSNPQYYSKPAKSIQNLCSTSNYIPVGCTYYLMSYHYDYKYVFDNKGFAQVSSIDMKFYYKENDFYVYIDDRYSKNSCEYNAIKKHEDLHVQIDQTVEINKVETALKECLYLINQKNMLQSTLEPNVKKCVQQAFDLDEEIRKNKNNELDADKTRQVNLKLNCPSS